MGDGGVSAKAVTQFFPLERLQRGALQPFLVEKSVSGQSTDVDVSKTPSIPNLLSGLNVCSILLRTGSSEAARPPSQQLLLRQTIHQAR